MTHGHQTAETSFDVSLDGAGSSAKLISRSVARDFSRQLFRSKIIGNTDCYGHSECDAIIMDNGVVAAEPEIIANHVDASLVHEAAIGKIAGDPAGQADDPWADRKRSGSADYQRLPEIIQRRWAI